MNDRDFCDRSAALAAAVVRDRFPHLSRGAVDYPAFAPGAILFFGRLAAPSDDVPPVVAKLREYLAIEEVRIHELGFGTTADGETWAMLAQSDRDADYCRRLVVKAGQEAGTID